MIFFRNMIRLGDITDGASNTYLVGEKYMNPDYYFNGKDYGSDQSWNHGCDYDVVRFTRYVDYFYPPM